MLCPELTSRMPRSCPYINLPMLRATMGKRPPPPRAVIAWRLGVHACTRVLDTVSRCARVYKADGAHGFQVCTRTRGS